MNAHTDPFENADIGEDSVIEPDVSVGFRYHPNCGRATIGAHAILRKGTMIYGDVHLGDYFQSGHYAVIRGMVRGGDYCTLCNHSCIEGVTRMGKGVRIMSHTYIPTRTWIGDNVFIGPGVTFLNDRRAGSPRPDANTALRHPRRRCHDRRRLHHPPRRHDRRAQFHRCGCPRQQRRAPT